MLENINIWFIVFAALIAGISPGPATLAIAGTSMSCGRKAGLALASGVTTGSLIWSVSAALGLASLMSTNVWVLEIIRYLGAAYLMYLGYRSAKSALSSNQATITSFSGTIYSVYAKGLGLHLTNPKAIIFFGALYSVGIPMGATTVELMAVVVILGVQSALMFHAYALVFSTPTVTNAYLRLRRWFEGLFAAVFFAAGVKVLLTHSE